MKLLLNIVEKLILYLPDFLVRDSAMPAKKKDDDQRNTMFLEFLRATQLIKPNMIIGENVKGLLSRRTSNNELYIDIIVSEFDKIGYEVIYRVFKCEEYGIPQKRERLIILGIKRDNSLKWQPSFP